MAETLPQLTERERQIVDLIAQGHNMESAAVQLGISPYTIKQHKHHIFRKLHVSSDMEMVLKLYDLREKSDVRHT